MTRVLLLAALTGLGVASAASAQSIGVSAVIVEPVEAAPAEYEVRMGGEQGRYEVVRRHATSSRSVLVERAIVTEVPVSAAPERSLPGEAVLRERKREEAKPDRLLVTRVIAANA